MKGEDFEVDWHQRYLQVQTIFDLAVNVPNGTILPYWFKDGSRFWFTEWNGEDVEYRFADVPENSVVTLARRREMVDAVEACAHRPIDFDVPVLKRVTIDDDLKTIEFSFNEQCWIYSIESKSAKPRSSRPLAHWLVSPNSKFAAFTRDHNLWIRDLATNEERPLTTDGSDHYAYAMRPASSRTMRRASHARPEALWSPDSSWLLTVQTDDRQVLPLYSVDYASAGGGRPQLIENRTSFPGDERVTEFRVVAIEVSTSRQLEPHHPRLSAVRMNDTIISAGLAWWSSDSSRAWFVDIERGEGQVHVIEFDRGSGRTHPVFTESSDAYLELGPNVYSESLTRYLPDTNELIWYSERSGYGHLYLYDLATGALLRALTGGEWQVREIQHFDIARREIYFTASGLVADEDPYDCKLCRASLDHTNLDVLTKEAGDHRVWRAGDYHLGPFSSQGHDLKRISGVSPSGNYFVETRGHVDALPVNLVRDRNGTVVMELGGPNPEMLPKFWLWPEPLKLVAADGQTPVYGLLFKPQSYNSAKRYPIIDLIYGGPQLAHVPKAAFTEGPGGGTYLRAAAIAALGCFVVVIDGRGTALRGKPFRIQSYMAIDTASNLEDHIAGIRQIADRYSVDLGRVGITGFSGGAYASALAAFKYSDFFQTAVAGGGNYDQSTFWHTWGERYHGLHDAERYIAQAVKTHALTFGGKILFIHGLLDTAVHPIGLFHLIQAMVEANRDYDLILLPNTAHELPGYGERRRLDYFVRHLMRGEPPKSFTLTLPHERPPWPFERAAIGCREH